MTMSKTKLLDASDGRQPRRPYQLVEDVLLTHCFGHRKVVIATYATAEAAERRIEKIRSVEPERAAYLSVRVRS